MMLQHQIRHDSGLGPKSHCPAPHAMPQATSRTTRLTPALLNSTTVFWIPYYMYVRCLTKEVNLECLKNWGMISDSNRLGSLTTNDSPLSSSYQPQMSGSVHESIIAHVSAGRGGEVKERKLGQLVRVSKAPGIIIFLGHEKGWQDPRRKKNVGENRYVGFYVFLVLRSRS